MNDSPFDPERPLLALAGANKLNLTACPICQTPGVKTVNLDFPRAFFFRDIESVRRYRLTACCQDCQDPSEEARP